MKKSNRLLPHICLFALIFTITCHQQSTDDQQKDKKPTVRAIGKIERFSPEMDNLVPAGAIIEVLADGLDWSEGPVWVANGEYLLFSDVPANKVFKWKEGEGAKLYLSPSGFTSETAPGGEGSNGLLFNAQGNLVLCQHGDRRVAWMNAPLDQPSPEFITLADKWNGKRFNSPNDACYDRAGNLYFTDPPYGLPKQMDDPAKEIPFQGVYRLSKDGKVDLLVDSLSRPNGIALSPDEKVLYIANSDPDKAIWMAYDVMENGQLANGRVFYDATAMVGDEHKGLPDGLKVDGNGNLFATGPGGCWVFKPDGTVLGRIDTGEATANCAFGNGSKALYLTADMYVCRVTLH
ncbi:MAG: SMP-30/gluconolactonase/LRE family protein [Saprospiraceae bacterium]